MQIPESTHLSTRRLNSVFDNTVATYKYYWFLGILDLFVKKGQTRIKVWDIMISMVVQAWYPVNYFRLSFGKSESLYQAILSLQKEHDLPINLTGDELTLRLNEIKPKIKKEIDFLNKNVPYRFLRPWIDTSDDKEMVRRSLTLENDCLYKLIKEKGEFWIELNEHWLSYLQENYCVLRDFAFWNLTLFLQTRNPNVPNIPNKIVKSETRSSLNEQRKFWNTVIHAGNTVKCIYTEQILSVDHFDLDHFIPWSFVSHDLLWNLMPADPSINSSKSNRLPNLKEYLPKLAEAHQSALRTFLSLNKRSKLLEDYLSLGCSAQELVSMDHEHLYDCFNQTFSPLNQIAMNMGFERWNYTNQ